MRAVPEERHPPVALPRDVAALAIPDGTPSTLTKGSVVQVTQTLGTSYTVQAERGAKYRVAGADGDALGMPKLAPGRIQPRAATREAVEAAARAALRQVFDPEIPVDVVNLGLVHEVRVEGEPGRFHVVVRMGLTSPGCGMGDVLVQDAETALKAIEGVASVDAKVVLFPVWNPYTMMSEAAKLKLGLL